jgi:phospholipid N-methyltransferase
VIFHQFSRIMKPFVRERFGQVDVRFVVRNVFPCFVLSCRKNGSGAP